MSNIKHYGKLGEKWTKLILTNMCYPAWRALSPKAQALYPWLKLEWKGPKANNNGKISLSVRQAAECMGVSNDTAAKAFHELQAKGFIVVIQPASLGVYGKGKWPEYEITEIAKPPNRDGRRLFGDWTPDCDFPVIKANASNRKTKPRPNNSDTTVLAFRRKLPLQS